jgi:NAD(P)-dependent dehydrogenase (short-subunit alcohol dehydrogenase family)
MKHEAEFVLAHGGGSIINNASMGGVIGFANAGLYIASKHAVLGMTKTASIEWFRRGVRVNAVNPGIIDAPFQDRIWPSAEAKNTFAASTVPGRAGTPQEVARVVTFLASNDATFVSGHGLLVDAGYSVA